MFPPDAICRRPAPPERVSQVICPPWLSVTHSLATTSDDDDDDDGGQVSTPESAGWVIAVIVIVGKQPRPIISRVLTIRSAAAVRSAQGAYRVSLQFKPLHPVFAAEASGIDLARPLSLDEIKQFNAGMNRYGVLVVRGQPLTGQQQIDFAQSFGPLDTTLKRVFKRPERLEDERLIDISNVDAKGAVAGRDSPRNLSNFANQLWHSDSSFMKPRAAL